MVVVMVVLSRRRFLLPERPYLAAPPAQPARWRVRRRPAVRVGSAARVFGRRRVRRRAVAAAAATVAAAVAASAAATAATRPKARLSHCPCTRSRFDAVESVCRRETKTVGNAHGHTGIRDDRRETMYDGRYGGTRTPYKKLNRTRTSKTNVDVGLPHTYGQVSP